jgi:SAM-dependent methyltransferase
VRRFLPLLRPGGTVLDLACGSGRHVRLLAGAGFAVTALDHDAAAVAPLAALAEVIVADLEAGPWPLGGRRFDGIVVTHYLWRPLLPRIAEALADDGVLIYETFAQGQQTIGRPSRAEFLLQPGELLAAFAGLRVVAFEDGFEAPPAAPAERFVQRLAAVRPGAGESPQGPAAKIRRFPLQTPAPGAAGGSSP